MRPVVAAIVFVVVVLATATWAALGLKISPGSSADIVFLVGALLLYGGTGFAIGQWRALALVLVTVLVAVPFGDPDDDGVPVWAYIAMDTVVLWGPAMLAGIAARKLFRVVARRRVACN